ncbi:MAG TPA: YhcH/YjgK/YiaL family protein [Mucilaginibacter sp.]|nr:YhcH/YjgK/YiaL family protein [Mucilaginibacter sp.]
MKRHLNYLICIMIAALTGNTALAQTADNPDLKTANKWVKSGEWRKGLKIKPQPSINSVEFAKQYQLNKEVWDKVFTYLRTTNLDTLKPGKYPIDGDSAFATITDAPSKTFDKSAWESHRKYIDLQYVIKGKETIMVAELATATVTNPYDEKKDIANYTAEGKSYMATPDYFFLFFPDNVHRPNILVDGYPQVKKLVIKIIVK